MLLEAALASLAFAGGGDPAVEARRAYRGYYKLAETRPRLACDRYLTANARRQLGDACDQERLVVKGEPWRARVRLHSNGRVATGFHTVIIKHPMCDSHSPGTVPQYLDRLLLAKRGWKISQFGAGGYRCVPR